MAASRNDDAMDVMRVLSQLYMMSGRPAHAVTLLRAVCLLAPDDLRSQKALARACIRAGNAAYALQLVERLQDGGDLSALLHLLRGQALAALGRPSEAREALARFGQLREAPRAAKEQRR